VRVAFLGNARWSVPSLEALAGSGHQVALVATRTPRPARRSGRPVPTPVAQAAPGLGLPLQEVETVKSGRGFDALKGADPEALVVVAYGEILPRMVLDVPSAAPVNVHFSRLPELRGAAPVQRAILHGLLMTGVTTIRMDEGLDTGPILLQAEEAVRPDDDAGSLGDRLAALGGRLLVETLDRLEEGTLVERPQDEGRATYAPKLTPEDRVIHWEEPAEQVVRRIRALAPEPAATTIFRGRALKVFRAAPHLGYAPIEWVPQGPPGTLRVDEPEGLTVLTRDGAVRLLELAPEGKRRMSGAEFVRGYRPQLGEVLG
jgi:methionyl-tRNA formyltransferase